jgi:hypothetical protein
MPAVGGAMCVLVGFSSRSSHYFVLLFGYASDDAASPRLEYA